MRPIQAVWNAVLLAIPFLDPQKPSKPTVSEAQERDVGRATWVTAREPLASGQGPSRVARAFCGVRASKRHLPDRALAECRADTTVSGQKR